MERRRVRILRMPQRETYKSQMLYSELNTPRINGDCMQGDTDKIILSKPTTHD